MFIKEEYEKKLAIWKSEQSDISKWYKHQANYENVEEFAHQRLNEDPKPINGNGRPTAEKLICSSAETINDTYRFGSEESKNEFEPIANALKKYQSKEPVILFRGVSDVPMEAMVKAAEELNEDGVDFFEKGFMSCSLLQKEASPYKVQLIIYVPENSYVMYAGHCNDEEEDHCRYECVIMRGAKLKILKQENDTYYCILRKSEHVF